MMDEQEKLQTVAKARIWDKSSLIEDAQVPNQTILQTKEFDTNGAGELEKYEPMHAESSLRGRVGNLSNLIYRITGEHPEVNLND